MKQKYPSIQALRAVLFVSILAFHCGVPYSSFGWNGVESFFVLSAFFLCKKQYGNDSLDVIKVFKHRIYRLYPPYIVVMIIALIYALLTKLIPYDLLTHFFAVQNFNWMYTGYKSPMQPLTAHTWTLSIEIWAGLLLLVLLRIVPKKQLKIAMYIMFLLGITYRFITIICGVSTWVISLNPIAHFDAFALGSILAIKYKESNLFSGKGSVIGVFAGIIGLIGIIGSIEVISKSKGVSFIQGYELLSISDNYLNNILSGNIYLFISLITVLVIMLLLNYDSKTIGNPSRLNEIFVVLGDNSYVLYLFHWPILVVIKRICNDWYILFPMVLVLSLFATYIFNKLFNIFQKKLKGGRQVDTVI